MFTKKLGEFFCFLLNAQGVIKKNKKKARIYFLDVLSVSYKVVKRANTISAPAEDMLYN